MARAFLGIDVGGTKVALALANEKGEILARNRRPTAPSGDPARDLGRLAEDGRALLSEAGLGPDQLAGVGVSVPGPLDRATRHVFHPPNLEGWGEVDVAAGLASLGAPVAIENDANAAALAEWRFGAGQGVEDLVYLTMSTGVGAGLILGGRLHIGADGGAGELGHAPVEWPGAPCACGLRGCLEAYTGGAAWATRLRETTPESSLMLELAGERAKLTPVHVVEAARRGDAFARAEIDRWLDYLARAIAQLVMTLSPARIVLGTIAVAAGDALCFAPLREKVAGMIWPHQVGRCEIVPAALGDELPHRAGICVALEALRDAERG